MATVSKTFFFCAGGCGCVVPIAGRHCQKCEEILKDRREQYDLDSMRLYTAIMDVKPTWQDRLCVKVARAWFRFYKWCDRVSGWPFENEERFTRSWMFLILGMAVMVLISQVGIRLGWWTR